MAWIVKSITAVNGAVTLTKSGIAGYPHLKKWINRKEIETEESIYREATRRVRKELRRDEYYSSARINWEQERRERVVLVAFLAVVYCLAPLLLFVVAFAGTLRLYLSHRFDKKKARGSVYREEVETTELAIVVVAIGVPLVFALFARMAAGPSSAAAWNNSLILVVGLYVFQLLKTTEMYCSFYDNYDQAKEIMAEMVIGTFGTAVLSFVMSFFA